MIFIFDDCRPEYEAFSIELIDSEDFDPAIVEQLIKDVAAYEHDRYEHEGAPSALGEILGTVDKINWRGEHREHLKPFHQWLGPHILFDEAPESETAEFQVERLGSWKRSAFWDKISSSVFSQLYQKWMADDNHDWHDLLEQVKLPSQPLQEHCSLCILWNVPHCEDCAGCRSKT